MNEKKEDVVKEGHTYDGIEEYDNPMPRWWINLFWVTIFFSIGYCAYYMSGIGPSHIDEYEMEIARANEMLAALNQGTSNDDSITIMEKLIIASRDSAKIKNGQEIYMSKCMACHGDKGQGLIGPNLTDDYWIHGGSLEEILHIINVGVIQKGMIPWETQLSEDERFSVIAFLRSIQGTNVEGKAPEGEFAEATSLD
jgi:cytochrome c oxidase cbb3-type subunit 3